MGKRTKVMAVLMSLALIITSYGSINVMAASKTKLNSKSITIEVGKTYKLKLKNNNKKVKWISKNKKIAKVTKKGVVKAVKIGKTYIVANVISKTKSGRKQYKCKVNVVNKPTETTKPIETVVPEQTTKSTETVTPEQTTKPTETVKPEETTSEPEENKYFLYTVQGSRATITGYNGDSTNIVIPDKIGGKTVQAIGDAAFQEAVDDAVKIETVVIPDTVERIGKLAFAACSQLSKVEIKGEKLAIIGNQAFDQCAKLSEINIPGSLVNLGEYAFAGCKELKSFKLPKNIASIGTSPFSGCDNLVDFQIEEGAKKIPSFAYTNGIKEIVIPSSVTDAEQLDFEGCISIEKVVINAPIEKIKSCAFSDCTSLKEVTIPNTVKLIDEYAFAGCTALESLEIPESVTSIDSTAFESADNFKKIIGVKGSYAETFANENELEFEEAK